jgi:hypothetical protein
MRPYVLPASGSGNAKYDECREELFYSLQEPFFRNSRFYDTTLDLNPHERVCIGIQTRVVALESCRAP